MRKYGNHLPKGLVNARENVIRVTLNRFLISGFSFLAELGTIFSYSPFKLLKM